MVREIITWMSDNYNAVQCFLKVTVSNLEEQDWVVDPTIHIFFMFQITVLNNFLHWKNLYQWSRVEAIKDLLTVAAIEGMKNQKNLKTIEWEKSLLWYMDGNDIHIPFSSFYLFFSFLSYLMFELQVKWIKIIKKNNFSFEFKKNHFRIYIPTIWVDRNLMIKGSCVFLESFSLTLSYVYLSISRFFSSPVKVLVLISY